LGFLFRDLRVCLVLILKNKVFCGFIPKTGENGGYFPTANGRDLVDER
jgi:hypothetical protein